MRRYFSFNRVSKLIVKLTQPYRIQLQKQAEKENLIISLKCDHYAAKWFFSRYFYYINNNRFKSFMFALMSIIDYRYNWHSKLYKFFTVVIPDYFCNKLFDYEESLILKNIKELDSKFPKDITDSFTEFFVIQDNKLIRGIPRWLFMESVIEVYKIDSDDKVIRDFYRTSAENPVICI